MLRIKSDYNVNKLLEKGFRKNDIVFVKEINHSNEKFNDSFDISILVNYLGCEVENQIGIYINNCDDIKSLRRDDIDSVSLENELDVLYDLIQEGVVEKI